MSIATVLVSVQLSNPDGTPAAHAEVRFTLSGLGVVGLSLLVPRFAAGTCDAGGALALPVVPNPPGTYYTVRAGAAGALLFTARAVVPGNACQLTQIMQTLPVPSISAAEQALLDLQAAQAQIEAIRQNIIAIAATVGTGGGGSSGVTSVTGTGVVSVATGTTTPVISVTEDAVHRFATDAEKATWNGKQSPATTLAGYGITDAAPKTHSDSTSNPHGTTATQVGADATGTAASLLTAHTAAPDPHPGYALESALGTAASAAATDFTPAAHAGSGGTAHANAVAAGAAGFMSGADKTKLDGVAAGAQVNPATADGVTEGATNQYFTFARVRATILTGLSTAAGTVVDATHSVLQAIGFLQKQASDNAAAIGGKQDALVSGTNLRTVNNQSLLGGTNLVVSTTPAGSTTQVQFNDAGALAGDSGLTFNKTAKALTTTQFRTNANSGMYDWGGFAVFIYASGNLVFGIAPNEFRANATTSFGWSSGAPNEAVSDTQMFRDAAGIVGQRGGTNGQTQRTYGTYTDASNYRRVSLAMTPAGIATLKPEGGGTGASGNVLHISGLPTANPGPGILWNNGGSVAVGT